MAVIFHCGYEHEPKDLPKPEARMVLIPGLVNKAVHELDFQSDIPGAYLFVSPGRLTIPTVYDGHVWRGLVPPIQLLAGDRLFVREDGQIRIERAIKIVRDNA